MHPFRQQWTKHTGRPSNEAGGIFRRFQKREIVIGTGGLMLGVGLTAAMLSARSPDPAPLTQDAGTAATVSAEEPKKQQTDGPSPVKVIGATADTGRPCAEQTWPYIDRRCLVEAPSRADETPAAVASTPAPPPQPGETTGTAASSEVAGESIGADVPAAPKTDVPPEDEIAKIPDRDASDAAASIKPASGETVKSPEETRSEAKAARRERRRAERKQRRKEEIAARVAPNDDADMTTETSGRGEREFRAAPGRRGREFVHDNADRQRERVIIRSEDDTMQPDPQRPPVLPFLSIFGFDGGGDQTTN